MRRGRMAQGALRQPIEKILLCLKNLGLNITVHCRRTASSSDMWWIGLSTSNIPACLA